MKLNLKIGHRPVSPSIIALQYIGVVYSQMHYLTCKCSCEFTDKQIWHRSWIGSTLAEIWLYWLPSFFWCLAGKPICSNGSLTLTSSSRSLVTWILEDSCMVAIWLHWLQLFLYICREVNLLRWLLWPWTVV